MTKQEQFDEKYGGTGIQNVNPWTLETNLERGFDPQEFKFDVKKSDVQIPQLNNLRFILQDVLAGDFDASKNPEFSCLNFAQIKKSLDWLLKEGRLSQTAMLDLFAEPWRLSFKSRPPTPEEFLSEYYLGDLNESIWPNVRKWFCEMMDPLKPYRDIILCSYIGSGKEQPLTSKIYETENKWFFMGDAKVGQKVLTPKGTQTEIDSIHPQGIKPVYKITLDNGKQVCCGLEHLWNIKNNLDQWITINTRYLIDNYKTGISLPEYGGTFSLITNIEFNGYEEQQCITVKDQDKLYITDEGIITHNSFLTNLMNMYIAVHYAMMYNPWKFFGLSQATVFTLNFAAFSQKKASEIYVEPLVQVLEGTRFFEKVRTHEILKRLDEEMSKTNVVEKVYWSTATPSSSLQMSNNLNVKLVSDTNAIIGMAQPLDEPIKLPNGDYTTMGNLRIGDKIASPSEGETEVLGIFPQGEIDCYKIELDDGRTTRCSLNHLWKVAWQKLENGKLDWQIVNTKFLLEHSDLEFEIFDGQTPKIKSIKYIGQTEQQCIFVSAKDHLYITNDNIITHNTMITCAWTELSFFYLDGWTDEKIMRFYNKGKQRINSRLHGNYYGRTVIDSSPNSLENEVDKFVWEDAPKSKLNFLVTGSRWFHVPEDYPEFYKNKTTKEEIHDFSVAFPLYKGGNGKVPAIIESEDELSLYDSADIMWCPRFNRYNENVYEQARDATLEFMRDFGGVPAGMQERIFYDQAVLDKVFDNTLKNIDVVLSADALEQPEHLVWDLVKDKLFNKIVSNYYFNYEPDAMRSIGIDLAYAEDMCSIAMSHVEHDKTRIDPNTGEKVSVYITDFTLNIHAGQGNVNLDAIRYFVEDLITLGQIRIGAIGFDGFQSVPMKQALSRFGLKPDYVTCDRTNEPYYSLIDLVFKNRFFCGKNTVLLNNLKSLQMIKRSNKKGTYKVDHTKGEVPILGPDAGRNAKDSADSVAISLHLLNTYPEKFIPYKTWDPTVRARTYENVRNDAEDYLLKMGKWVRR